MGVLCISLGQSIDTKNTHKHNIRLDLVNIVLFCLLIYIHHCNCLIHFFLHYLSILHISILHLYKLWFSLLKVSTSRIPFLALLLKHIWTALAKWLCGLLHISICNFLCSQFFSFFFFFSLTSYILLGKNNMYFPESYT